MNKCRVGSSPISNALGDELRNEAQIKTGISIWLPSTVCGMMCLELSAVDCGTVLPLFQLFYVSVPRVSLLYTMTHDLRLVCWSRYQLFRTLQIH